MPIFAIGDFNFDYDFHSDNGNEAFREFMRDHVWKWIRPKPLVDSNWYDRDEDGIDDFPDSMLDFTFVAGAAKDFDCKSRVIVRDGDFPDDRSTSDHRPVELVVRMPE